MCNVQHLAVVTSILIIVGEFSLHKPAVCFGTQNLGESRVMITGLPRTSLYQLLGFENARAIRREAPWTASHQTLFASNKLLHPPYEALSLPAPSRPQANICGAYCSSQTFHMTTSPSSTINPTDVELIRYWITPKMAATEGLKAFEGIKKSAERSSPIGNQAFERLPDEIIEQWVLAISRGCATGWLTLNPQNITTHQSEFLRIFDHLE